MDRVLGQDTELLVIQGNVPLENLLEVRSFEMEISLEILRETYLGRTTDDYDTVFRGVSFRLDAHFGSTAALQFIAAARDKARNREFTTKINIKTAIQFPSGERPIILLPNVALGPIPLGFPGRTEYGTIGLSGNVSDFKYLA